MKRIVVMNGWTQAPHCWRKFLSHPINWDRVAFPNGGGWLMVSIFGVAFFWNW